MPQLRKKLRRTVRTQHVSIAMLDSVFRSCIAVCCGSSLLWAQSDIWDMPPLNYSQAEAHNRVSDMATQWQQGPAPWHQENQVARVRDMLKRLKVPESSQILVFSKTSKQNALIHPQNPRALYFSLNTYCGFVPGGAMEIIEQDPQLGAVFYLAHLGAQDQPPEFERDRSDCLSCHGTARTENVPGVLVRSVFPATNGQPIQSLGTVTVNQLTPLAQRWGGYYVTGNVSQPHLGNRCFAEDEVPQPLASHLLDLREMIDVTKYPRPTSDVVALLVLEHQCQAHNLLNAARIEYQRAAYLSRILNPDLDPSNGSAGKLAERSAQAIVECFLFKNEASLGETGVEGDAAFQQALAAQVPHTSDGSSLADFSLGEHLFKNRCSYMIYSEAFAQLPSPIQQAVKQQLRLILSANTAPRGYEHLKTSERQRILRILQETRVL